MTYTRYIVHYMTKNGMTTYETTSHSVGNWKQAISQARQTRSIPYSTKIGKEDVEEKTESLPEGWDICKRLHERTIRRYIEVALEAGLDIRKVEGEYRIYPEAPLKPLPLKDSGKTVIATEGGKVRIEALELAKKMSYRKVGEKFGVHATTIRRWQKRLSKEGFEGINMPRRVIEKKILETKDIEKAMSMSIDENERKKLSILMKLAQEGGIQGSLQKIAKTEGVSVQVIMKYRRNFLENGHLRPLPRKKRKLIMEEKEKKGKLYQAKKNAIKLETNTEEWKNIEGYNGKYQVSSFGRVRENENIKQNRTHDRGYLLVDLTADKKTKTVGVARLVYEAFFGETDKRISYINNDKSDCRLQNLVAYGTKSKNNEKNT